MDVRVLSPTGRTEAASPGRRPAAQWFTPTRARKRVPRVPESVDVKECEVAAVETVHSKVADQLGAKLVTAVGGVGHDLHAGGRKPSDSNARVATPRQSLP
jgi:hypothetical protein